MVYQRWEKINTVTDHYIEDIWIDEDIAMVEKVRAYIINYGMIAKEPEPLSDVHVLGLRVNGDGNFTRRRDGLVPEVGEIIKNLLSSEFLLQTPIFLTIL